MAPDNPVTETRLLVEGAWTDAADGATFATVNPADGVTIASVASAGEADVDRAVASARRALESGPWSRMSAADRGRILWKMGERILEESGRLALLETLDTGKTLFDSGKIELPMAAQIFQFYAGAATKIATMKPR